MSLNTLNADIQIGLINASIGNLHSPAEKSAALINEEKITKAAHDFEAVFISEMIKPMFQGLKTDGIFGGGQAEEVFRSIMIQEYGKVIASTDRVGIAPKIKEAMIKLQEQQSIATKNNKDTTTQQIEKKT